MTFRELKTQTKESLTRITEEIGQSQIQFNLEESPKPELGDLSTNISFQLTKILKKNTKEIAEEIISLIKDEKLDLIEEVYAHENGYINFRINYSTFSAKVLKLAVENKNYGSINIGNKKRVMVEHTSVNPNKALHVGHLRNVILGDTISRILEFTNHDVTIMNYIDDSGIQVAELILGFKELKFSTTSPSNTKFDHYCGDTVYVKANEKIEGSEELQLKVKQILKEMEKNNSSISIFAKDISKRILEEQLKTCWRVGAKYNILCFESSILNSELWEEVLQKIQKKNIAKKVQGGKLDGCIIVDVEGDEKVLVRSDGTTTYIAKDLANAFWKLGIIDDRFKYKEFITQSDGSSIWATSDKDNKSNNFSFNGVEKSITVIDSRQTRLQQIVTWIIKQLHGENVAKNYQHLKYEVVALNKITAQEFGLSLDGNSMVHMSGRKGTYVNADYLLDSLNKKAYSETKLRNPNENDDWIKNISETITTSSIRYEMLKQDLDKIITFDISDSLKLTGETGPYLLYSKARASRILEKVDYRINVSEEVTKLLIEPSEKKLIRNISKFDIAVEDAVNNLAPKHLARYCWSLAVSFNEFYEKCPVIKTDDLKLKESRIILVKAFMNTITKTLDLLGIESPNKI